jgi:hypothetical protein
MKLTISNNLASNPQTVDLSQYINVQQGEGFDVASPTFTEKVFTRSLLREGATLALEQLKEKEIVVPLLLGPVGGLAGAPQTLTAPLALIQQINAIINTPGFTVSWTPDGASQPTVFDGLSGQLDILYSFRREEAKWEAGKLRLFTQPLGRPQGTRAYATASGPGPLFYLAPSSYLATLPSPGGVSYSGNASLAGDAPAQLVMTFMGASAGAITQYAAVSVLPDANYFPLNPSQIIGQAVAPRSAPSSPGGFIWTFGNGLALPTAGLDFLPVPSAGVVPTLAWAGNHRLFAFARASGNWCRLVTAVGDVMQQSTTASVGPPGTAWGLYDLGTFPLRPSQALATNENYVEIDYVTPVGAGVDVAGLVMLPDYATWFLGPSMMQNGNLVTIIDTLGEQFISGFGTAGFVSTTAPGRRNTAFSRGLMPRPDPKNGLPIIAFLGMPTASNNGALGPGLTPPLPVMNVIAQVQERTRFVLP